MSVSEGHRRWRSERDSNPRCPLQGTPAFQASTFVHSVITPTTDDKDIKFMLSPYTYLFEEVVRVCSLNTFLVPKASG